jgi:hypothetical protein
MKRALKVTAIVAPYVFLALYGLFSLGSYFFEKAHEDTVVPLVVNRGNRFEMHYDNSVLSSEKHWLWVNGYPIVRTSPAENEPTDEFIKEFVMSVGSEDEPYITFFSYLIKDETIIYKTSDMEQFEILGSMRLASVQRDCKDLLEDMDCVIMHQYPIHAILDNQGDVAPSESAGTFGTYEGLGYRIEALTNGIATEWQFYVKVYDGSDYVGDEKIFSMRWEG